MRLLPRAAIVVATEPVDLRRGHDGLATLVRSLWNADPYSGQLFVFFGMRRDRIKILFFRAGGFVVYFKRLESGRFAVPTIAPDATHVELDETTLAMLLDGVDLRSVRRTKLWAPAQKSA